MPTREHAITVLGSARIIKVRAVYRRDPTALAEAHKLVADVAPREEHARLLFKALGMTFRKQKSAHAGDEIRQKEDWVRDRKARVAAGAQGKEGGQA